MCRMLGSANTIKRGWAPRASPSGSGDGVWKADIRWVVWKYGDGGRKPVAVKSSMPAIEHEQAVAALEPEFVEGIDRLGRQHAIDRQRIAAEQLAVLGPQEGCARHV